MQIVARKLGPNHVESLWSRLQVVVGLDDSMSVIMKAEMRWMNPDLHAKDSAAPDILPFIYFDALNYVRPTRLKYYLRKESSEANYSFVIIRNYSHGADRPRFPKP